MPEWLVSLIAPLFSVGGVAVITKVALAALKSLPKKTDKKNKELETQNKLLRDENEELKEFIKEQSKKVDKVLEMQEKEHDSRITSNKNTVIPFSNDSP